MMISIKKDITILALLIYFIMFWCTLAQQPVLGDDGLHGIINHSPNILKISPQCNFDSFDRDVCLSIYPKDSYLSKINLENGFYRGLNFPEYRLLGPYVFYQYEQTRIPIFFHYRHGGLAFLPLKVLTMVLPLKKAYLLYQLLIGVCAIILFSLAVKARFGNNVRNVFVILLSLDPLFILSFGMLLSEKLLILSFALCFFLLANPDKSRVLWAGVVCGIGLYIKFSFFWYMLALAAIFYERKFIKHFLYSFVLVSIFWGILVNWKIFLEFFKNNSLTFINPPDDNLKNKSFSHFLLMVYSVFANRFIIYRDILDISWTIYWNQFLMFVGGISGFFFSLPFFPESVTKGGYDRREYTRLYGAVVIFIAGAYILLTTDEIYAFGLRMTNLSIIVALIASKIIIDSQTNIKKGVFVKISVLAFVAYVLFQSLLWIVLFRSSQPVTFANLNMFSSLAEDLSKRGDRNPKAINTYPLFSGAVEMFTDENVTPIYPYEAFESIRGIDYFKYVLKYFERGSGYLLYSGLNNNTHETPVYGPPPYNNYSPKEIKEYLLKNNIKIFNQKYYYRKNGAIGYWVFDFEN